ncbi:LuxR C-terminal-related transcriptional regulator [Microbacterium sp. C23T]
MPDTLRDSLLGGRDLQAVLLESKTQVPPWRTNAVSRLRQIERARASDAGVVSIAAPAGYGKSTMLAEWAAAESRAVAWVSLERTDDDPAALLPVLASACASFSPVAGAVVDEMRGVGAGALGRSAPLLAAVLATAPRDFVLFIDDLHLVGSPACQDALEVLLARVPSGSQVVLTGRQEPPVLARLRAQGVVWEMSSDDLSLDAADARTVFDEAGAPHVTETDLAGIVAKCEGWPTGLYLCALVARAGGDATTVTGDERYVADYLYRECIERLPEATQIFLRRSAVLDQMSPEACNAVLQIGDARRRLGDIEAANLFLVPMDRTRSWFRFHALFREYLLVELERSEGSEAAAALHLRAAQWHEEHGAHATAVEHLLTADESARAATLVAEIALEMYEQGQITTVRRWFQELGPTVLLKHPTLIVLRTWAAALLGEVAEGEKWSALLDEIDASGFPDADRVQFESARSMVRAAMCRHGHEQVAVDAAYAVAHEPLTSPWRAQALHLWGSAATLRGDTDTAGGAFAEAVEVGIVSNAPDTVILSEPELALIAIDRGRWAAAAAHAQRGVDAIDTNHLEGYPTTALALAVAARVAVHLGERERGERLLARGMRARVGCTHLLPWLSLRVRLQLAKAHVALGDRSAAFHLLAECDHLLRKTPDVGVIAAQIEEFRAGLSAEPHTEGTVPLTPAELRLLPYLQTHLTIAEIGQRLYVSRNTVSSQLSSVYRKLAVTTRGAAVERAVAIGLLGG